MLTLQFLMQEANDLFEPVAGLNDSGLMLSFFTALDRTRVHLLSALKAAQPGGGAGYAGGQQSLHEDMCYNFHVGTSMLMAFFDGLAVYVEKKVAHTSADGSVYWDGHTTFIDSRFAELYQIKQRTTERVLKGGISAKSLRNFVKHYLPWVRLSGMPRGGNEYDILFPLDQAGNTSGPVLRGLLFPLFNDARDAYIAFGKIIDTTALPVHPL